MGVKGYPQQQLDGMEETAVQEIVTSLKDLYTLGRPETDEEVELRIDQFFELCRRTSLRPGIESLCLSLHIVRQTFLNWTAGIGCSERRQRACEAARGFINSYLEQASLSGKINPASGIFLLKNWAGYRDTVSFEAEQKEDHSRVPTSREEIQAEIEGLLSESEDF